MKIADFIVGILSQIRGSINQKLIIKRKCNLNGHQYWQAYDLNTNQSYTFASEQDVRVWIENHYRYFD